MNTSFPLFYAGNIEYFSHLLNYSNPVIDKGEYFQKQTYRNRCVISTANGLQTLVIPTIREHKKTSLSEMKISYAEKWQQIHWRAITSAYKNSPYFEFYEHLLLPFYQDKTLLLADFNIKLNDVLLKILKVDTIITYSETFIDTADIDFRNHFLKNKSSFQHREYLQVFSDRFPFQSNLSIFDLVFNCGPRSKEILK